MTADLLSPIERSRVDDARKSAEAALAIYAREDVEHELALRLSQMVRLVDRLAPAQSLRA